MSIVANTFEGVTLPLISVCINDDHQYYAYQQNKPTEQNYLAVLPHILSKHLDSNSRNSARCLFVDFTCALHTISPTTLVNYASGLWRHQFITILVNSFMANKSQRVIAESGCSTTRISSVGSPQGCVWSPLLFSIYVQEIPIPTSGNYHLIKYADDTILVAPINPWQRINTWHCCQSTDPLVQL